MKKWTGFLLVAVGFLCLGLDVEAKVRISNALQGRCWGPRMAIDSQGNIYAIWMEEYSETSGDLFFARYSAATKQWSTPLNLSNSGAVACDTKQISACGLDGSRRFYAVWGEIGGGIRLRTLSGDSWTGVENIASLSRPEQPRIAVDSSGNLFLSWYSYDGGEVFSRARVGGSWEAVKLVSSSRQRSKFPDIALNNGVVYAVFIESTYDYQVVYCRRSTSLNAGWTAPAAVYTEFPLAHHHPSVLVDSSGIPHIAWSHVLPDESANSVVYSYWTGNGFSTPLEMSGWTFTHWPMLAQKDNAIYVLWQEGSYEGGTLFYRNGRGSNWSGLNAVAESDGAGYMDFTIDSQGNLCFVWNADGQIYYHTTAAGKGGEPRVNQPPVAQFGFSPTTGYAPVEIQFDGSASSDPDGWISSWNWLFGDGESASGSRIFHTYQTQGQYQVQLTVVDNEGGSATQVKSIEILGVSSPLNIRWATFVDEGVFLTRYVTEVTWERNPANDRYTIVRHNVYRKNIETNESWKYIGQTSAQTFRYLDTNVKKKNQYAYAVTVVDDLGHESRIGSTAGTAAAAVKSKARPTPLPRR